MPTDEPPLIFVLVPDAGNNYQRVIYRDSVGNERKVYDALHDAPIGTRVVIGAWCYERTDVNWQCEECKAPWGLISSQSEQCRRCGNRTRVPATVSTPNHFEYDRNVLIKTLVYHWPTKNSSCLCGWDVLGALHSEHVADMYEEAMMALGSKAENE